jgi:hypothetical protein
MCPAHLKAAQYILRVNESENYYIYNYNQSSVLKTKLNYAYKPLLLNSYLDTTYSAMIVDYDPYLLKNIWTDITSVFNENDLLYSYINKPVTLDKYRTVILRPDINQIKLSNKFNDNIVPIKTIWTWKSYIIDDQDNWHTFENLVNKQVIFKSANKILTIKPELLGTQTT